MSHQAMPLRDTIPLVDVKVRCLNRLHAVHLHPNGKLAFPDHNSIEELKAEDIVAGVGGKRCRCSIVLNAWQSKAWHELPPALAQAGKDIHNKRSRHWRRFVARRRVPPPLPSISVAGLSGNDAKIDHVIEAIGKIFEDRGWPVCYSKKANRKVITQIHGVAVPLTSNYVTDTNIGFTCYPACGYGAAFYCSDTGSLDPTRFVADIERYIFLERFAQIEIGDPESKERKKMSKTLSSYGLAGLQIRPNYRAAGWTMHMELTISDDAAASALMQRFARMIRHARAGGKVE